MFKLESKKTSDWLNYVRVQSQSEAFLLSDACNLK